MRGDRLAGSRGCGGRRRKLEGRRKKKGRIGVFGDGMRRLGRFRGMLGWDNRGEGGLKREEGVGGKNLTSDALGLQNDSGGWR